MSLNCFALALGYRAPDPPPFAWLAGGSSLASLYLVILILTTQRGDDRLTQRRELLNLELTNLSEQKIAKVVLERCHKRSRRGSNHGHNHADGFAKTYHGTVRTAAVAEGPWLARLRRNGGCSGGMFATWGS